MPQKLPADIDLRIIEHIRFHTDGIGITDLHGVMEKLISRRSLQRRLTQLVTDGKLLKNGQQRALKYRLALIAIDIRRIPPGNKVESSEEHSIPLSREGQEVKNSVHRPYQMRKPVGYNQAFLEAYYPNETAYLTADLRDQLRTIGAPFSCDRPAGTFARDIMNRLLIDLSWSSSRLEGNTYSRLDTERLIEFGQAAEGKDAMETQMILNHKAAIELLVGEIDHLAVTPNTIFNLHALLSDGLLADPRASGRIRKRVVEIGGSVYRPIALPQRIEELFKIILNMAREIHDPFEQSFFLMVHLPYLQPFEDVNKRVSRLATNIPLIRYNLCPLSFLDVPEQAYIDGTLGVYELNRIELLRDVYIWVYERSCQQYLAVRQELVTPDTFRLRYRYELSEAVRSIILRSQQPEKKTLEVAIPPSVAKEDHEKFVLLVQQELENLHEGNAIRFGIRPAEFAKWRKEG